MGRKLYTFWECILYYNMEKREKTAKKCEGCVLYNHELYVHLYGCRFSFSLKTAKFNTKLGVKLRLCVKLIFNTGKNAYANE
jgi:hypothetical protein